MSWFTYYTNQLTPVETYSFVRRAISIPAINDNIKIGDWIHVNISEIDIGRLFFYENGLIKNKIDQDSYLVVFESGEQKIPTYSIIIERRRRSFV